MMRIKVQIKLQQKQFQNLKKFKEILLQHFFQNSKRKNNSNQKMKEQQRRCCIIKIKSPFHYVIEDMQNQSEKQKSTSQKNISQSKIINLEVVLDQKLQSQESQKQDKKECFLHLLPALMSKQSILTYQLSQTKQNKKFTKSDQIKKGYLYLNGKNILPLYKQEQQIAQSNQIQQYSTQQIIQCYVVKVQCLKLILLNLQTLKYITFYFSQFKLVRPNNIHPKQSWEVAQKYFIQQLEGEFLQIKVNGTQKYREQMNVYGQILRIKNGDDIKQKIISDGYVEVSKNANKYLSQELIEKFISMAQQAKNNYKGIWGLKQNKQIKKSLTQVQQAKYKKWQLLISQKNPSKIKNIEQQCKQILIQFKKINSSSIDYIKCKIILNTLQLLLQNIEDKKYIKYLQEAIKNISQIFMNLQISIVNNTTNMQFLKFYSKLLTFCIFYLQKLNQLIDTKQKQKVILSVSQMEKILKTVFKTCYIGNQTFNQRLFGKKKQTNFQNFSFDTAYLNGGISSYSQQSDYDQNQQPKFQNKSIKKVASAHTKIRINSTYLISLIFKTYPSIVQNQWEICVNSNILTADFFEHLKRQKINAQSTDMTEAQRKQLSHLLKNNFGDPSLLLLTIFQRNIKVRTNALNCVFNMIINFQGKKMINTTESFYIEKLLKSTKSSYVPKSFIIFSGLKNTLYFLLFTLKYEKNIEIIQITFKTLCELCNQCSLLDKLEFQDGMKLLMQNYIQPVMSFPWNIPQLQELKVVCISFLSVLVSTQKKWDQIQTNYLLSPSQNNINQKLLSILQHRQSIKKTQNDKVIDEIIRYFTKLSKQYFESIFFQLKSNYSIWTYLSIKSLQQKNILFSNFISQLFKFNFDKIKIQQESNKNNQNNVVDQRRKNKDVKHNGNKSQFLLPYLENFIPIYSNLVTTQNYLNLINILSNIQQDEWQTKKYSTLKISKQFIYHIFDSITGTKLESKCQKSSVVFPSINDIQENSLIRVSLIKLLGYMSFCSEFQKQEVLIPTIKILLQYAKKYKSPNTIIKVTWAISNWVKVDIFTKCIKKEELQQCINYLVQQGSSDKQKIASNSTRGIGFFLNQTHPKDLQQLAKKCRKAIINNLDHSIIKVRTNSTRSLRSMISQLDPEQTKKIASILQQNILKNNFHLQSQTILLIKELPTLIQKRRLLKLYMTILKNLLNQSELQYEFSQIKTIKQLRKIVLEQVIELIEQVKQNDSIEIFITIYAYLVDCYSEEKSKNEENKILQKGQQKGQQVEKLIFNIKNKILYNQENIITTQTTLKGFQFYAKSNDLVLISKIKDCATNRKKYSLCPQWSQLQGINVEKDHVAVGNLYI